MEGRMECTKDLLCVDRVLLVLVLVVLAPLPGGVSGRSLVDDRVLVDEGGHGRLMDEWVDAKNEEKPGVADSVKICDRRLYLIWQTQNRRPADEIGT